MILKLAKKILNKKLKNVADIGDILDAISKIAHSNEPNLAICIQHTDSSFLGVKNATLNLFPKSTIVLPAYYSQILLDEAQFHQIATEIKKHHFHKIIISTLPVSMNVFLDMLCENENVNVIFHGALSELSEPKNEKQLLKIIENTQSGKIKRLGFVKSGLDKWAKKTFAIDCVQLQLKPLPFMNHSDRKNKNNAKIKIGIFGNTSFNKNLYNQIAGALAVDNTEIHTTIHTGFEEIGFEDRIIVHPFMNHHQFIELLSQMTLNLHLSFSEGMGGQVFTESLSQGIPCLTSYNNEYLKFDTDLLELLTVEQYDNPWEIKKAIERVLEVTDDELSLKVVEYSKHIEKEYHELLDAFLK
jgi:glycosyltransferase involved in cell wall biosynthesis